MTGTHLEVEDKFDVPPGFVVPDLFAVDGVAAVERPDPVHLAARYFDTEDLRLLRFGATLRRREGGADAGWHLKLAKVAGERLEVTRPLTRSTTAVPVALRRLVHAHAAGRPLRPVAELRTRRTVHRLLDGDGEPVAEVSDDEVTGVSLLSEVSTTWREVEAELVGGDRELLAAVGIALAAAGAQPAGSTSKVGRVLGAAPDAETDPGTVAEHARALVSGQLAALVAADPLVRIGSPDAVHTFRGALRRLRATVAAYPSASGATTELRAELRWLDRCLGGVRDAEVVRRILVDLAAAESGPGAPALREALSRRPGPADVTGTLDSPRYLDLLVALDSVGPAPATGPGNRGIEKGLARVVARERRRVLAAAARARAGAGAADAQHELRRAGRRARWVTVATAPVLGGRAERLAAKFEGLSDASGAYRDASLARAELRRIATDLQAAGESCFAVGRVDRLLEERVESAERARDRALSRLATAPGWLS